MFGMKSCSNEEQMINKRYQEYQLYWYQKCIQLTLYTWHLTSCFALSLIMSFHIAMYSLKDSIGDSN